MTDDLQIQHNLQGFGEFVSVVRRGGESIATMKGPDREANARKFMHVDELVEAGKRLSRLNQEHGHFGGEMYRDRVDRAWESLDAILAKIDGK